MAALSHAIRAARHRASFAHRAGYLPESLAVLHDWHKALRATVAGHRAAGRLQRAPSVARLQRLIDTDPIVRLYLDRMIDEVPPEQRHVADIPELLDQLDHIVRLAPEWETDKSKRVFFPMSALFGVMMTTDAGMAVFRYPAFNDSLRDILKEWCAYLDSPASRSVLNEGPNGWLSPPAFAYNKLDEFVIPDRSAPAWGWPSFNAFFHRQIRSEVRPIAGPGDPAVVVSANDGTMFSIQRKVQATTRFWLKGQPYSLHDMLAGSPYTKRFVGGDVFQTFLSGADFHRWHAPIDGIVREARVVDGLMFSNAESEQCDPSGTDSQGYETAVNTRGLVVIESDRPALGLVCVIPVGITEISSVTIDVDVGRRVTKGEEIGRFSYGGSTLALVFQPGAIAKFTVAAGEDPPATVKVNAQIAVAN
ncbi:MAG: phosphatidylserine decarboxylase family protein [Geminicoccaceae bacterium]